MDNEWTMNGQLEIIKYVVSLGANIREKNDECVRTASQFGFIETVKYLVSIVI
jgi:hypothetical protein